jgi:predicted MFS family arabinose efflux permease
VTDSGPPATGIAREELASLYLARFAGNWGIRFVYPFLPTIARGLGIPLDQAGLIAALRELSGVASPLLARPIDRGHKRRAMVIAMGVFGGCLVASGALGGTAAAGVMLFTLALVASGLAKAAYDVASNAWLGDFVPFARRGRVIGTIETAWAVSFLVGAPVAAWLIDRFSWRAPFFAVAIVAGLAAVFLRLTLREDVIVHAQPGRHGHLTRPAIAFYVMLALQSLGPQLVFASFGAWLEESLGYGVAAIGTVALLLGVAELAGSTSSARFTDRLGKKRSVLLGMAVIVPATASLGMADGHAWASVAALCLTFVGFEFAIVSALPMASELDPEARASGLGMSIAAFTLTRAIGTALGVWLYVRAGIGWTGALAAFVVLLAIGVLVQFVEEPTPTPTPTPTPAPPEIA